MSDSPEHAAPKEMVGVEDLALGYGTNLILDKVGFSIPKGEIVTILGGSGCGKSTLLKGLIGLLRPVRGRIRIAGREIYGSEHLEDMAAARRSIGVLFQSGALIGSLTLAENVALPVEEFSGLPAGLVEDIVRLKLDMVKLSGFRRLPTGGVERRHAQAGGPGTRHGARPGYSLLR